MSKAKERQTDGEPAVANPRSVCLNSRNLNIEQASPFGRDASNAPGGIRSWIQDLRKGVTGNCSKVIMCVTVQGVAENCRKKLESNFEPN